MSIDAAFALVIFPPGCEMTLLVSELAFATRVMRESRRTGRLPSGLPFYLRSACRAQNTPALRTHALLPRIRCASQEVRTPAPRQAVVPFRRFYPVALGVGRDGTPVGQACTADSGQTKRKGANTMFNKVILIGRLGQNAEAKTAQNNREYVVLKNRNPGELEERQRRLRNPHRVASRLCLEKSLEVRQNSPEGAAHHA